MKKFFLIAVFLFVVSVSPALADYNDDITFSIDGLVQIEPGGYYILPYGSSIGVDYTWENIFSSVKSICIVKGVPCSGSQVVKLTTSGDAGATGSKDSFIYNDFAGAVQGDSYYALVGDDRGCNAWATYFETCSPEENDYGIIQFFYGENPVSQDIVNWGGVMVEETKENIFAVIAANYVILILLLVALLAIFLVFKILRKILDKTYNE